jgi:hypothetical protein
MKRAITDVSRAIHKLVQNDVADQLPSGVSDAVRKGVIKEVDDPTRDSVEERVFATVWNVLRRLLSADRAPPRR